MTNVQKKEVIQAIITESDRLGSAARVADKCGVSSSVISQMMAGKYTTKKQEMWVRVANSLNVQFTNWQIAAIGNYNRINLYLNTAKNGKMFIPVSEKAGSGKSETVNHYVANRPNEAVFLIRCDEWARREFLENLCKALGIKVPGRNVSVYQLGQKVVKFFEARAHQNPLLIIDEGDKLKAPALRYLIPLYNKLEDKLGCVMLGTENLHKEIKRGVRLHKKGYDEIDSRFGRNYMHLHGATYGDVAKIAAANGITEKRTHEAIFKECEPVPKVVKKQTVKVVEDLRRVKRIIKRENLLKTA